MPQGLDTKGYARRGRETKEGPLKPRDYIPGINVISRERRSQDILSDGFELVLGPAFELDDNGALNLVGQLTTQGDLLTHDGSTQIRIGVGSDGQALLADSGQSSGLAWTTLTSTDISGFNESVEDVVGALIQDGTGISWTYDDANGTLTGNVLDENIEDVVSNLIQDGTGISWTYDDPNGTLTADIDQSFSPTWTGNHTFDSYIDLTEIATPADPGGSTVRIWVEDVQAGHSFLHTKTDSGIDITLGRDQYHVVKNDSGGALSKGDALYISGSTGTIPRVDKAKADSSTTMPAIGISAEAISNGTFGIACLGGEMEIDTSSFADGDQLFVSDSTAGGLTTTAPTGTSIAQSIGFVVKGASASGTLLVEAGTQFDESFIDHDQLTGFVANEHIDHSSVTITGGTGISGGGDITSSRSLSWDGLTVEKGGSAVGTRPRLNLIEGSNVTLTVTDDSGNSEVDVTIAASSSGGDVTGPVSSTDNAIATWNGTSGDTLQDTSWTISTIDLIGPSSYAKLTSDANLGTFTGEGNPGAADTEISRMLGVWNGTTVSKLATLTGPDTTNKDDASVRLYIANAGSLNQRMRVKGDTETAAVFPNISDVAINDTCTWEVAGSIGWYITSATPNIDGTLDKNANTTLIEASASDVQVTLPPVADSTARIYTVKRKDSSTNGVSIVEDSGDTNTIEDHRGAFSSSINLFSVGEYIALHSDGSNWYMVRNGLIKHFAEMTRDSAQSISSGSVTKIDLDNTVSEIGGIADTTNSKITVKRAGVYVIVGFVVIPNMDSGEFSQSRIHINGTSVQAMKDYSGAANQNVAVLASIVTELSANDDVELYTFHNEGSTQNTQTGSNTKPRLMVAEL